jgi:hypothetical protein
MACTTAERMWRRQLFGTRIADLRVRACGSCLLPNPT